MQKISNDMKKIKELIDKHCTNKQVDLSNGLNELLDYLIEFFDYKTYLNEKGYEDLSIHYSKMKEKSEPLFMVCLDWLERVDAALKQGSWFDYFGELYENQYQTKSKASSLGQFFTPPCVCDLMSELTINKNDCLDKISDCCCGSGRTLLSHFAESENKQGYYVGEDSDVMSVKMCALNFMIHGMRGKVVHHDTLANPNYYDYGFEINEVRYPIPTPFYSLRKISNPKPNDNIDEKKENEKQLNLF